MSIQLGTSLAGMQASATRFARTASSIAKAGTGLPGEGDLSRDLVDTSVDKATFDANVKVARASNEMLGTLLDIFA